MATFYGNLSVFRLRLESSEIPKMLNEKRRNESTKNSIYYNFYDVGDGFCQCSGFVGTSGSRG